MEDFDASGFEVTAMLHPSTYLNKILLGARDGTLQLWNIRTQYVGAVAHTLKGGPLAVSLFQKAPQV